MLHSKYAHKNSYEDPKTSAVFENLMLLPDNVFWHILKSSCFNNAKMQINSGRLVSYYFWPHWDNTGTDNQSYVEPDLFISFKELDVIIEAKYGDYDGQGSSQWKRELTAYNNEYGKEGKPVVFIAVGGNMSMNIEEIKVRGKMHFIFKCNWLSLLIATNRYRAELKKISIPDMSISATLRLLDNIILAFNINGVYNIDWFNSIATEKKIINESTLKSKACLKCLYFMIIIFDLCCYLEYFSYLYTIN